VETFVVRVWRLDPVEPDAQPNGASRRRIRGVVRDVGRGTESTFDGPGELLALLTAQGHEGAESRMETAIGPDGRGRNER
jgi:hypothetical protein